MSQNYQNMISEIKMLIPCYQSTQSDKLNNFKTLGQYLENEYTMLKKEEEDVRKDSNSQKNRDDGDLKKFKRCRANIEHAAANLIQKSMINAYYYQMNQYESDYSTESNLEAAKQAEELYLSNNGWEDPYREWTTGEWEQEPYLLGGSGKW